MDKDCFEILKILNDAGFFAYIVGGSCRNYYMGIPVDDIDICTSARPEDVERLFKNVDMAHRNYGSVRIDYNENYYEITTFRKDIHITEGVHSCKVEYVDTLEEDLQRRDFIMNTLCLDASGKYIDLLGARNNIMNKIICTVGDPYVSFREDPLRMLRAIRFATCLEFNLSQKVKSAIEDLGYMLENLSFSRKKGEIDKIFMSPNVLEGIEYMNQFSLQKYLSINTIDVKKCSKYLGIWAQCDFDENFPFSKKERKMISSIREVLNGECTFKMLYQYGMEICSIVDEINGTDDYSMLNQTIPIHNQNDIKISRTYIVQLGLPSINKVYSILESEILKGNLKNEENEIRKFLNTLANKI